MVDMHGCYPITEIPIVLEQDLKFREISLTFPLSVSDERYHHYRMAFYHTSAKEVWRLQTPSAKSLQQQSLVMALKDVPEYAVKYDDETSHAPTARTWSRRHAWGRITDILPGGKHVASTPTSLRKPLSIIDLGKSL